jgi:hypothetical protein
MSVPTVHQTPNAYPDFIIVSVLVGLPTGPVSRALCRHAIDSSPDGVMVNVVDDLVRLPHYDEGVGNLRDAGRGRRLAYGRQ